MRLSFPENDRLRRKNREKRLNVPFSGRCQAAIFEKISLSGNGDRNAICSALP
jgi:hypothetical protein